MNNITGANIDAALNQHPRVILDFWAPTCNPCRTLAPVLEALEKELAGKVIIGKVNIEEESDLANAYKIQSLPTLLYFQDGQPVEQSGVQTKRELLARLKTLGWL